MKTSQPSQKMSECYDLLMESIEGQRKVYLNEIATVTEGYEKAYAKSITKFFKRRLKILDEIESEIKTNPPRCILRLKKLDGATWYDYPYNELQYYL